VELELARVDVPLGGAVELRITLRNDGSAPVETASLFDNNVITNYELSDADDRVLEVVNHVTRQRLMEKVEPRTNDFRLVTLPPGGTEERQDNLCRYLWLARPGTYYVRGLYRWNDEELRSAPARLEILPAPLGSYDQQWSYHYGEKFLLHACWVAERPDGASELYLRESLRFNPETINHNPSLGALPERIAPRVSFNRTLVAGGSVWLAWLGRADVSACRTLEGRLATAPQRYALPLAGLDWAAPPLTSESGEATLLVSGVAPGAGRRVTAIRLAPDGSEERRADVTPPLPGVVAIHGVCDDDGGFHLFWLTGDTFEVRHQRVDLDALAPLGAAETMWRADAPPLGIFTPPVLTEDSFLACLVAPPAAPSPSPSPSDDRALRLQIAWLGLDAAANPLKARELALPGPDAVVRASGETNESGHLYALVTTQAAVYYVNGALMQWRAVAKTADLFADAAPMLTVNQRNDVFLVANRRPAGLAETLVHRGGEEDLSEGTEASDVAP
jgi:hypothetical protein